MEKIFLKNVNCEGEGDAFREAEGNRVARGSSEFKICSQTKARLPVGRRASRKIPADSLPDDKVCCRLSKRKGTGPVAFGKMALEVAVIVKDAGHLNYSVRGSSSSSPKWGRSARPESRCPRRAYG